MKNKHNLFDKYLIIKILSFIGLYEIFVFLLANIFGNNNEIIKYLNYPFTIFSSTSIKMGLFILPIILLFYIVLKFLPKKVFKSWNLFTLIYMIPFIGVVLYNRRDTGFMDEFVGIYIFPMIALYALISIVLISVIYYKAKKKMKTQPK